MIVVEDLTRRYGSVLAVNKVSFQIRKGEIVGLLGKNGAGKTTIMKMLTGFLEPSSGSAFIDGYRTDSSRIQAQDKIGYLPENCPIYSDMTVLNFLIYCARLKNIPNANLTQQVKLAIDKTMLKDKLQSKIANLSRGYRQRVGVAQALLGEPEILILDEPTNGLDPDQITKMRHLIKKIAQKSTVIISTHIMQEVEAMCSRVLMIKDGQLIVDSSIKDLQATNAINFKTNATYTEVQALLTRLNPMFEEVNLVAEKAKVRENEYRLNVTADSVKQTTSQIANSLIEAGYEIYSIVPVKKDIESLFKEINKAGDKHAA